MARMLNDWHIIMCTDKNWWVMGNVRGGEASELNMRKPSEIKY